MAKAKDNNEIPDAVESKIAETTQSDINELFAKGKAHYDKGEYDDAEKFWREAAHLGDANAATALTWIEAKRPKEFEIKDGVLVKYNGDSENVVIPDGVTSIGEKAFISHSELKSVAIPNSVTSIGKYAFYYCDGLTSIEIPSSVTSIVAPIFSGCSSLASITVASGNEKYCAVCNCMIDKETKTLVVGCKNSIIPPDGSVTLIGDHAFYGCGGLTSIDIPDSVTVIGDLAFRGCSLTSITIPNSVTSIENMSFDCCSSLTSIAIPNSVTSIGWGAFYDCSSLTCIAIPNSVTTVNDYAFCGCESLTVVEIPNSVTSIGGHAFDGCDALYKTSNGIRYRGSKKEWKKIKKNKEWKPKSQKININCIDGMIKA